MSGKEGAQGCVDLESLRKPGYALRGDVRCRGHSDRDTGEPERRVPSQQPYHAEEAGTAYIMLKRVNP